MSAMRGNFDAFRVRERARGRTRPRVRLRAPGRSRRLFTLQPCVLAGSLGCAASLAVPVWPALVGIDSWYVAGMVATIYCLACATLLLGFVLGAQLFERHVVFWRFDLAAMAVSWIIALFLVVGFALAVAWEVVFPVVAVPAVIAAKVTSCFAGGLALGACFSRVDEEGADNAGEAISVNGGITVASDADNASPDSVGKSEYCGIGARRLFALKLFVAAGAVYAALVITESVALSTSVFWHFCLCLVSFAAALTLLILLSQPYAHDERGTWNHTVPPLLGVAVAFCTYRAVVPFDSPETLPLWAALVAVLLGATVPMERFNRIHEEKDAGVAPSAPSSPSMDTFDTDTLRPALMPVLDSCGLTARERAALLATCQGLTSEEVAVELDIKAATVRSYLQRAYRKLGVSSFKAFQESYATQLEKKSPAAGVQNACARGRASNRCGGARDRLARVHGLLCAVSALALLLSLSDTAGVLAAVFQKALFAGALAGVATSALTEAVRPCGGVGTCLALVSHVVLLACVATPGFADQYVLFHGVASGVDAVAGGIAGWGVGRSLVCSTLLWMDAGDNGTASLHALRASCAVVGVYAAAIIVPALWIVAATMTALVALGADVALLRIAGDEATCNVRQEPRAIRAALGDVLPSALVAGALVLTLLGGISGASAVSVFLSVMLIVVGQFVRIGRTWGSDVKVSVCGLCAIVALVNVLWGARFARVDFFNLLGVLCLVSLLLGVFHAAEAGADARRIFAVGLAFGAAAAFMLGDILWIGETVHHYSGIEAAWFYTAGKTFATVLLACVFLVGGVAAYRGLVFDRVPAALLFEDGHDELERVRHLLMAHGLNQTEAAVLIEIARGSSGSLIAHELSYSKGTVNSARRTGYRKLGIHGRDQLVELLEGFLYAGNASVSDASRRVESEACDGGIV